MVVYVTENHKDGGSIKNTEIYPLENGKLLGVILHWNSRCSVRLIAFAKKFEKLAQNSNDALVSQLKNRNFPFLQKGKRKEIIYNFLNKLRLLFGSKKHEQMHKISKKGLAIIIEWERKDESEFLCLRVNEVELIEVFLPSRFVLVDSPPHHNREPFKPSSNSPFI